MCWERRFHARLGRGVSISRCGQLPPTVPEVGRIMRYALCFPQTWGLLSFPRACANYPKSIEQGIKSVIFKAMFRRSCAEPGEGSSADSTRHSTASGKRNAGLAGIMLIAPLTAKKKSICRQSGRNSFIKAGIYCDWRKTLSSVHFTVVNWNPRRCTHSHTEIVKILTVRKQNLGTFGQDFVINTDCVRNKTQQNFQMNCSVQEINFCVF